MVNSLKIMLIDDEPEILDCLSAALALKGFPSEQFCNPKAAIETYMSEEFDVVISDFKMPEMNGIEVLKAVRKHDPNAYLIILTGYSDVDNAIAALNNGAYAFFRKPLDINELLQILYKIEEERKGIKEAADKIRAIRGNLGLKDLQIEDSKSLEDGLKRPFSIKNNINFLVDEIQFQSVTIKQVTELYCNFQNSEDIDKLCPEIALKAVEATCSEHGFILLMDQSKLFLSGRNNEMLKFEINKDLINNPIFPFQRILQQGCKIHLPDYQMAQLSGDLEGFPGIRDFLAVPMIVEEHIIAILAVFNSNSGNYTDLDTFFLNHLSSIGVTALRNARTLMEMAKVNRALGEAHEDLNLTYKELQDHVVIVDQVQEINRRIHESSDLQNVLHELVGYTFHLLACDFCVIVFYDERLGRYNYYSNNKLLQAHLDDKGAGILELWPFNLCYRQKERLLDNDPPPRLIKALQQYGVGLSNYVCVPFMEKKNAFGIFAGFNKKGGFSNTDKFLINALSNAAVTAVINSRLTFDLKDLFHKSVEVLANAIEARDKYTRGHTERVTAYSMAVARKLGWNTKKVEQAYMGTLLHDIGKIGIPDAVLNKPGWFTEKDFQLMKTHVVIGVKMIKDNPQLKGMIDYVRCHHERYDGRGYPAGLKGKDIPVAGRIVSVADSFDAITSTRPYRKALSVEIAVAELERCSGSQFDPHIVEIFLEQLSSGTFQDKLEELNRMNIKHENAREVII